VRREKWFKETRIPYEFLNGDVGFMEVNSNFDKQIMCLLACSCVHIVQVDFRGICPDLLVLVFVVVAFRRN